MKKSSIAALVFVGITIGTSTSLFLNASVNASTSTGVLIAQASPSPSATPPAVRCGVAIPCRPNPTANPTPTPTATPTANPTPVELSLPQLNPGVSNPRIFYGKCGALESDFRAIYAAPDQSAVELSIAGFGLGVNQAPAYRRDEEVDIKPGNAAARAAADIWINISRGEENPCQSSKQEPGKPKEPEKEPKEPEKEPKEPEKEPPFRLIKPGAPVPALW